MKKLLTLSLIGSSLLLGSNHAKADWDFWDVVYSGDASIGNYVYTLDSSTGEKTLRTTKLFNGNSYEAGTSYVDGFNNLVIQSGSTIHKYNLETDTWTDVTNHSGKIFGRHAVNQISGDNLQIKKGTTDLKITSEGIGLGDKNLIKQKANGELHIGENSWITKEENGRQKVYAKDAAGNSIPIDYTNGSKLLINGRDVEQSINNVGALSAALTGLPTVPTDTDLACGLGTGTHGGDFAFSGGCASRVNDKLSINYAVSMTMPGQDYAGDFEDTLSARAGFIWKLGKSNKPNLISMKEKETMEVKIDSLEDKNKKLEDTVSTLIAKLERLEKIALRETKTKDLATIKLP